MFPGLVPQGIRVTQVAGGIGLCKMVFQDRYLRRIIGIDKLAVSTESYVGPVGLVPDVELIFCSEAYSTRAAAAITGRSVFFHIISSVRAQAPVMSVGTNFAIYIKIIQQHKVFGQSVVIGRNPFAKQQQACIAIALRHI